MYFALLNEEVLKESIAVAPDAFTEVSEVERVPWVSVAWPVIVVAVNVPSMFTLSFICIAVESPELISFISKLVPLMFPLTLILSVICTAVESSELIVFVVTVVALNVPDT